jgi:hypothetical protein
MMGRVRRARRRRYDVLGQTHRDDNGAANYRTHSPARLPAPVCEVTWTRGDADLSFEVQLKVRNLSYAKVVDGTFRIGGRQESSFRAHFVRTLADGRELWQASGTFAQGPDPEFEFATFEVFPSCTVFGADLAVAMKWTDFPGALGVQE